MIERRYGPNRDWLYAYGPGDKSTTWVCGAKRAVQIPNMSTAKLMLDRVIDAAAAWDNREWFTFVIIEDRSDRPYYFASTEAV
jgi:hypothetical protein